MTSSETMSWQIGRVRITRVCEIDSLTAEPQWTFPDIRAEHLASCNWLYPNFVTDEGALTGAIQAFIIETGDRRIVVDTCVGNGKTRSLADFHERHGDFLGDLAAAGYPVEDIDTVLCTHLHVDHVGWNTRWVDGRWVPTFPNATYLCARREWEHWNSEFAELGEMGAEGLEDSVRPIFDAGLLQLVDTDHRVNEDVWLEPTPGHTPGHVSVRVSSDGQDAVITGDLLHHPVQVAFPHLSSAYCSDPQQAAATRAAFVERYADRPVLIFGTHFALPTAGFVVRAGERYRFQT